MFLLVRGLGVSFSHDNLFGRLKKVTKVVQFSFSEKREKTKRTMGTVTHVITNSPCHMSGYYVWVLSEIVTVQ